MDLKFAQYTKAILDALPHWFKIRKGSAESIGARFLNIVGLKLDDVRYVLDYAYDQTKIGSADINQIDFCYKAIVPMPISVKDIVKVSVSNIIGLKKAKDLKEFFGIQQNIQNAQMNSFETYYVDEKRNIIYVRNKFNVDAIYDNGKIDIYTKDGTKKTCELIPHQIWNFFDEFGLLLSCPRLFEEDNASYKKRILDVFLNPANASRDGLINGIGRELSLRRTLIWEDPSTDLELTDAMIVLNSIKVDQNKYDLKNIYITEAGTVLLKAIQTEEPIKKTTKTVTYVYGLEMHKLWDKDDIKLVNELFTIDNKPKERLMKYIAQMNSEAPIFWNEFIWNEHYWDPNTTDVSGYGTIPTSMDGSIHGFLSYGVVK